MKTKTITTFLCVAFLGIAGADSLGAQARGGGRAGPGVGPGAGWQGRHARPMRGPRMQNPRGQGPGMAERAMAGPMGLDLRIGQILDRRHTLDLTDGQVTALTQLRDEVRAESEALRSEMTAIREGRQDGTLDRDGARERAAALAERRRALHEAYAPRLHELLEPRQRALLGVARRGMVRR